MTVEMMNTLEADITQLAGVRFFSGMNPFVGFQVVPCTKHLITRQTLDRF